jgi:AcrR family transcriptional regulator
LASEKDSVGARILSAARKRFAHYGYGKTTMAELAGDCSMSPGNLYRFFPGKLDIAEAIAREEERDRMIALEDIARAKGKSARTRLKEYFFHELRSTYKRFEEDPNAIEIARIIARERPQFSEERIQRERALLAEVLREGADAGEFAVCDYAHTAELLHSATLKFRFPQRWTRTPLPVLERELAGVFGLLTDGLVNARRPVPV